MVGEVDSTCKIKFTIVESEEDLLVCIGTGIQI